MIKSSLSISDLGRQKLISELGNYGNITHIFFVDNSVIMTTDQASDDEYWKNLYYDNKLYPVKDIRVFEDISKPPTYQEDIFEVERKYSDGKIRFLFSLTPDSDKIRDLFTLTNQNLSFYLGSYDEGNIYGLKDGNYILPFPTDLINLEPPKLGQGSNLTFTKLRTEISNAKEFISKFYVQKIDFDLDFVDKQLVNVRTYIYSPTNVNIRVTLDGKGVTDLIGSNITIDDNLFGTLAISIIQNYGDGNYNINVTQHSLTDGTIQVLSKKYIGCDNYIYLPTTIAVINYDFEDGVNYEFEDGVNFEFN